MELSTKAFGKTIFKMAAASRLGMMEASTKEDIKKV
jgi:hypothetical protein